MAPFLTQTAHMRRGAVLLKSPIIAKHLVAELQCNRRHLIDVSLVVDCAFIEYD